MLLMTGSATVLGLTALIGVGGRNALFANEENEAKEALIKAMDAAKISLQQGLEASEQHGQPISAKFEIYREGWQVFRSAGGSCHRQDSES
jgi:hypothetical protein